MRHILLLVLTVLVTACFGAAARAAADGEKKPVEKVKVVGRDHKEHKLNLKDPAHKAKLDKMIADGEVESLQEDVEKNLLEIRWDLGAWTVVVFVLLFLILRKAAWGPMLEGLKKREDNIQAALVEAKEAREEARKLKDELTAERNKAAEKVAEMLAEARRDAEYAKNEMISKAKAEIQTERDRLLREVGTAKDQALQEIGQRAAGLAASISSKAIKKNLSADDHRRLVDEAISELGAMDQQRKRMLGL